MSRMSTLQPIIAAHPLFNDLAPEHLELIAGCARNIRFQPGTFLFRAGEEADTFYLLRHGKVALQVFVPERGALTIQTIEAGDVLGWSWLFPPYRWQFDAEAIELTRAIAFDGQCLRAKCEADHDLGYQLMQRFAQVMMQRLQATRIQLLDIYGTHA